MILFDNHKAGLIKNSQIQKSIPYELCRDDTCCTKWIIGVCRWRCEDVHVCICWIIDCQLKPACSSHRGLIRLEAVLLEWDHSRSSARLKSICTKTEPTTKWENYCTSKGLRFFKWGFMRCLWQTAKQARVHPTLEKRSRSRMLFNHIQKRKNGPKPSILVNSLTNIFQVFFLLSSVAKHVLYSWKKNDRLKGKTKMFEKETVKWHSTQRQGNIAKLKRDETNWRKPAKKKKPLWIMPKVHYFSVLQILFRRHSGVLHEVWRLLLRPEWSDNVCNSQVFHWTYRIGSGAHERTLTSS